MGPFCDCTSDGYCNRYGRVMAGRFREICAGRNTDLGTAAAFRAQWQQEAPSSVQINQGKPIPLLLKTAQAPGDAVAMTAAIYSLHKAHPGRYLTAVESPWPEVFANNPYVVPARSDMAPLEMHYPAIHQSNHRAIHFMQGWCEFLSMALGVNVPLLTNRPHLYFEHPLPKLLPGHLRANYWVLCAGGKRDFTNKQWPYYKELVQRLKSDITFVQVGSANDNHPPIEDTITGVLGHTTLSDLFELVRRARGVVCGVSLLMHVAAALEKPAVVIAGGREPVAWNAYPKQHYVHTVGCLPCSDPQGHVGGACWRSRTIPLGDSAVLDKDPCLFPEDGAPRCMRMIKADTIAELVLRCNGDSQR